MTDESDRVLLADVGGTNVRFALADPAAAMPLDAASIRRYRGADFEHFAAAVRCYASEMKVRPRSIVIAAAGPCIEGVVKLTNLPWTIAEREIADELGFATVALINDFVAMGLSVPLLGAQDVVAIGPLQPTIDASDRTFAIAESCAGPDDRTFAIVGPGTGLGVGGLLVRGGRPFAIETEGGHIGFAPGDALEIEILRRLAARFGRVSNERVLCGSGLSNLHEVLAEIDGIQSAERMPEEITAAAGNDPVARRTLEIFATLLGSVAGDIVLGLGAWDGLYLTGGLAPELVPWLESGAFRRRFEDKGRLSVALQRVPVAVVRHAEPGLLGTAAYAAIAAGRGCELLLRSGKATARD